ncbi:MAG: hypothetical protein CV087_07595 [Candidatus Brocadia sp. WS118]|nr:MAG: hypothetical protein CV087_07595 [Candidatus Brocadia sp. WS118]
MSLDVYLLKKGMQNLPSGKRIFIREGGQNKEISREEWDKKYPGREPVTIEFPDDTDEIYTANITHNLNKMADEAGIYQHLWRPDEIGITNAEQLIEPLQRGLQLLKSDPEKFKKFNPSNGWGNYEGLVNFVHDYLKACVENPDADVVVWR